MTNGKKEVFLINDDPIRKQEEDQFNFCKSAEILVKTIKRAKPPYSFGIFGPWGSGKTGLMNLIRAKLSKEKDKFECVHFNAWEYEKEQNLLFPLLRTIEREIGTGKKKEDKKIKETASIVMLTALDIGLRVVTKHAIGETLKLADITNKKKLRKYKNSRIKWVNQIFEFKRNFKELVDELLKDGDSEKRLVIFIDELDRCLPENAINLLESIKNFLNIGRCIFVFGMDKKIISQGIKAKYERIFEDIDGNEYLEKIVQLSFDIPKVTKDNLREYIKNLLKELNTNFSEFMPSSNKEPFFSMFAYSKVKNPRKVKKIINHFYLFLKGKEEIISRKPLKNLLMLKWIIICICWYNISDNSKLIYSLQQDGEEKSEATEGFSKYREDESLMGLLKQAPRWDSAEHIAEYIDFGKFLG